MVATRFESALVNGDAEDALDRLAGLLEEGARLWPEPRLREAAERARLSARYAHALRVRVVSLGSRRGLSRARDEIVTQLSAVIGIIEAWLPGIGGARRPGAAYGTTRRRPGIQP